MSNTKRTLIEMANTEGYTPAEVTRELVETMAALGSMEIDKHGNSNQATWTLTGEENTEYEVTVTRIAK